MEPRRNFSVWHPYQRKTDYRLNHSRTYRKILSVLIALSLPLAGFAAPTGWETAKPSADSATPCCCCEQNDASGGDCCCAPSEESGDDSGGCTNMATNCGCAAVGGPTLTASLSGEYQLASPPETSSSYITTQDLVHQSDPSSIFHPPKSAF